MVSIGLSGKHYYHGHFFKKNETCCRTFGNGMMNLMNGFSKLGNFEKNVMKRVRKQPGKGI